LIEHDRELVRRMLAGDERAFESFFDAHFDGLYRFALPRLGRPDAAEEVAQAAICKALAKLRTYRGEAPLFSWLCTFCRHEIWALTRRERRLAPPVELIEESPDVRAALESWGMLAEDAAAALDRTEIGRLVHVALDHLPAHHGSALEWKYLEDLPVSEIATRLSITPKAAESLLTRARDGFREIFSALIRRPARAAADPTEST